MKKYYVGLDIGTDSIGWAATNEDYSLMKFKGNAMWGIRLLEESKTAEERRAFRSARRRLQRRKYRQKCLEMLFSEEISKVDMAFFQRLKESSLLLEDKSTKVKYTLFNDVDYTDKHFYGQYPTIYHLRKELIENKEPKDVRLVYLAIHHIIKNRGHFLFDSENFGMNDISDFNSIWAELNAYLYDNIIIDDVGVVLECNDLQALQNVLKNRNMTRTAKKEKMMELFGIDKKADKRILSVITLLSGGTAKSCDLFDDDSLKASEAKSVSFSNGYDDNVPVYEAEFGDNFELIERLKAIYDWGILAEILCGEKYISFAKVRDYDQHKSDLKLLKKLVKSFVPEKYNLIFNVNNKNTTNYLAYSGHCKKGGVDKKCTQEAFCDFLKKTLPQECPGEEYADMYQAISAGSFMPKNVDINNGVIPMQLNKAELCAILNNVREYLPFLANADEKGVTVADKIISIFSFRVPYYVGPLNSNSPKAWLERKEGVIYPWNFNEIVNVEKSAEKFIGNLTNKCTYLPKEDVIPRFSLLYCAFTVLNELNNLKLDGDEISVELKQCIFNDLFMKRNKITGKMLASYLKSKGFGEPEITGIDGDFKSSLKPFIDLKKFNITNSEKENVIKAITIFGEDKKMLRKKLENQLGNKLSEDEIKALSKLKYTGWSRLSKAFLMGLEAALPQTGEVTNIIHALWETNDNLMQLLSHKYGFVSALESANSSDCFSSVKDEVDSLYVSPKVKRPIYQSLKIIEEIVKINGCTPEKIFIEVARGAEEKKRTVSRRNNLIELYKSCKKEEPQVYNELMSKKDENEFRRDALYLYFTQLGRCAYTGQPIDIGRLYEKNLYDIDHIYPRSKVKDDSLDNRVLVLKTANEEKTNVYPISESIRNKQKPFWGMLLEKGLISKKKYERLVRCTALTDSELEDFIARQIVETRQSTKAVADLLKKRYPDTEIVYVKAALISDFRSSNQMIKCREVNDLHHAKDAYLNIVVGNVYNVRYTHSRVNFISNLQHGAVSLNRMFDYTTDGAWIADNNQSMITVKSVMKKNNIRFTRYSHEQHGGLFDQNPLKKGSGELVSLKMNSPMSDVEKYGGYNMPKSKYFVLAEYEDKKGKTIRSFEAVDSYLEKQYLENPEKFIAERIGTDNVRIIIPKVKYNTLISLDGFRMHISSKSNGGSALVCKPAVQLILDDDKERYLKNISNYLAKCNQLHKEKEITVFDKITNEENIQIYDSIIEKLQTTVFKVKFKKLGDSLESKREVFLALSLYCQCFVINELLKILHNNVMSGDLSYLGEAKKSGITTISNKLPDKKKAQSFKIVHQSVTGLFEKETELLI